jgi:large subunit ribosomal protein L3
MGTLTVTIQNLEIVAVDLENNCLLIKGNVPGPKKSLVLIRTATKNPGKINEAEELITYEVVEHAEEVETTEEVVETTETVEEN